jgi:hypothetical protein
MLVLDTRSPLDAHARVGQLFRKDTNQHILSGSTQHKSAGIDLSDRALRCGLFAQCVAAMSLSDQQRQKRVRDDKLECEVVASGMLPHFE